MFDKARLKLTAWYLLIIMLVSFFFSLIIYRSACAEMDRFAKAQRQRYIRQMLRFEPPAPIDVLMDDDLMNQAKHRIFIFLALINITILAGAGGLGYFLAGKTLFPIALMIEEQNRFVSDASHELRTPLTALKSSLEVNLRDRNLTLEQAKKLITESIDDVNRLEKLSNSLLELSRYDAHQDLQFEKVPIRKTLNEAVKKIRPLSIKKEVVIKSRIEDLYVKGNPYKLIELFVVLLDNGIKYSDKGKKIMVTAKKTDHKVIVAVTDEGMGINEKDIPNIFDRFYRASASRSRRDPGGYGLGLSIAKKIVENHKGTINVKSKLGKGTTFTVILPFFSKS